MSFTIKKGKAQAYAKFLANNTEDEYSEAVVVFAESWGEKMEKTLEAAEGGIVFTKKIYNMKREADMYEKMSGIMRWSAVSILSCYWKHGDKFHEFYQSLRENVRVVQSGVRSRA